MRRTLLRAATAVLAAAATATAASAQAPAVVRSTANGNAVTGGLSFAPANITVHVGDVITWTNTDFFAPHTVTERHDLWDLGGGYGQTPINPSGFGPGQVAQRRFEAGTQAYFCRVHPTQMTGVIAVPVDVSSKRGRANGHRIATVQMRWAADPPKAGLAFDVQRRAQGGEWATIADGTTAASGSFRTSPGRPWEIRARLRKAGASGVATDWSPAAEIVG